MIHEGTFADPSNLKNRKVTRTDFVTRADVRAIEVAIEAETVRLAKNDGDSVRLWVERLIASDSLLGFKACNDTLPEGSGMPPDTFFLAIQTPWQREIHEEIADTVLCVDGTHNTTQYYNCNLYTILGRDKWGHGMLLRQFHWQYLTRLCAALTGIPLAWLIASNGKQETLQHYFRLYRQRNPKVPKWMMSDKDLAQINAMEAVWAAVLVLLCWWHVLHAWQQHFSTKDFPELWELLKQWIRVSDEKEFQEIYRKIKTLAPTSFGKYIDEHWMNCKWSSLRSTDYAYLELAFLLNRCREMVRCTPTRPTHF